MKKPSPNSTLLALFLLALGLFQNAWAVLEIEISGGVDGALPIAVVPFATTQLSSPLNTDLAKIISADLDRSGLFKALPADSMPAQPSRGDEVDYAQWRDKGQEYLVVGRVMQSAPNRYELQFQLLDIVRKQQLVGYSLPVPSRHLRQAAHEVADLVFEKITGIAGAFNSRIAYVSHRPGVENSYVLEVSDTDGFNARTILESQEPLLSPDWSPNGESLTYVSFESGRPEIYIQHLSSAQRTKITGFKGLNSAPSWSPAGDKLALVLSKDGNPEIYILDLSSKRLTQLTDNRAIDTEPVWTPDGQSIIFTSDRSASPQLYEVPVSGGTPRRITFEGRYNASADISPDGTSIAMLHGDHNGYHIAVMDRKSRQLSLLSSSNLDESPSFAPNGKMILYATREGKNGVLYAISTDARARNRLSSRVGEIREPAWGPFRNKRPAQ